MSRQARFVLLAHRQDVIIRRNSSDLIFCIGNARIHTGSAPL